MEALKKEKMQKDIAKNIKEQLDKSEASHAVPHSATSNYFVGLGPASSLRNLWISVEARFDMVDTSLRLGKSI